jgi:hypothetical protein
MFEEHEKLIQEAKEREQARKLLQRAAHKLQDYCTKINRDLNDSLTTEIEKFLRET